MDEVNNCVWTDEDIMRLMEEIEELRKENYRYKEMSQGFFETTREINDLNRRIYGLEIENKTLRRVNETLDATLNKTRGRLFRMVDGLVPVEEISKYALYCIKASQILG